MVRFKRGVLQVGASDFVKCPFCKRAKKDGKLLYTPVTIESITVLTKSEDSETPFLSLPITLLLDMGPVIKCAEEMDRTAYDGPGLAISCSCERGHEWILNICMHEGRAIQFIEEIQQEEPEIEEAGLVEEEEEEDEDEES